MIGILEHFCSPSCSATISLISVTTNNCYFKRTITNKTFHMQVFSVRCEYLFKYRFRIWMRFLTVLHYCQWYQGLQDWKI